MKIHRTTPILRIFDEAKARQFYVDFLGFKVDWEHRFAPDLPLYLQVSRDGCILHLSEHHGDCCPGSAMRIEVDRKAVQVCAAHPGRYPMGNPRHVGERPVRQSPDLYHGNQYLTSSATWQAAIGLVEVCTAFFTRLNGISYYEI